MIGPERYYLFEGDNRSLMANMGDNTVDAVVTDGPYELVSIRKRFGPGCAPQQFGADGAYARAARGFMGQVWDGTGIVNDPAFWAEVFRVLKPGGFLLSFGGTRTYHRMACAVEDAGFEIRDMISWIYGSGFPKGSVIDGRGPALKPAQEPIVMARKPLSEGSIARNLAEWGTGALRIDDCRVGDSGGTRKTITESVKNSVTRNAFGNGLNGGGVEAVTGLGRFPANVIHDGSSEVLAGFPETSSGVQTKPFGRGGIWSPSDGAPCGPQYGDSGSAARFFAAFPFDDDALRTDGQMIEAMFAYCAKASKRDRNSGLDGHVLVSLSIGEWENADQKVALRVDTDALRLKVIGASGMASHTEWNNALFGSGRTVPSLPDMTCITRTEINSIITSIIWNCSARSDTNESTEDANRSTGFGKNHVENAEIGFRKSTIINEKMAFLLGVDPAVFKTQLKISVDDGRSGHPTVKPTDLMRYLVRLVTPPGGLVFDPFTGSGSTGKAAMLEGMRFIGAEMTAEYVPIARARIEHARLTARS